MRRGGRVRRSLRFGGALVPLVLLVGALSAPQFATARTAQPGGPVGFRRHTPARLIHIGPAGAVYQLSDGRRMVLSHTGPSHIGGNAFASLFAWGTIRAHGQLFGFSFQASRGPGVDGTDLFLDIGNGRFKSNRQFAFQDHGYEFFGLGSNWVHISPDLSSGTIATGDLMGAWGDIELDFKATGPAVMRCGGKIAHRPAAMTGHFSFTPQRDNGFFGTISSLHVRKSTIWVNRGCNGGGGGGHGRMRCPIQPFTVDGMDQPDDSSFVDFFGSQLRGRHRALIGVNYQQFIGDVSVWHEIDAMTAPGAASLIAGDGARLKGFANNYESGGAVVATSGPPQVDGPYPCGRGKSVTYNTFYGTMSGAPGAPLTAQLVTGPVSVPASPDGYDAFLSKARIKG